MTKNVFIHPSAIVETDKIGDNTRIWAFSHVLKGSIIGEDCNICDHTFIENNVQVGNQVTLKCGVYLWEGITLEDDVFIGPNATFTNDLVPRSKQYPDEFLKTYVKKGASIGANATIIAGNTIGAYAMIGAGSVVTKDIPNNTLWYGNPCEFKGYICDCGKKLSSDLCCAVCEKQYKLLESQQIVQIEN